MSPVSLSPRRSPSTCTVTATDEVLLVPLKGAACTETFRPGVGNAELSAARTSADVPAADSVSFFSSLSLGAWYALRAKTLTSLRLTFTWMRRTLPLRRSSVG